jgi:hypothetical protein
MLYMTQSVCAQILEQARLRPAVISVPNNGAKMLDRIDDPNAPPPSDAPAGQHPA